MPSARLRRYGDHPADVYRCYDVDGRLLYIGCSINAYHRMTQHRRAPWFPDLALFTVEARAILDEKPLHNILSGYYIPDSDERAAAKAQPIEHDDFELATIGAY